MLYYDRIDISKGNGSIRSNRGKEYMIFHYWFLIIGLNFKFCMQWLA